MYDPVELAEFTIRTVCKNNRRRYYRFRPSRFYGGISTALRKIASWLKNSLGPETPWHVTRFYPQFELSHLSHTPVPALENARAIRREEGLWYVYLGNVPGHTGENTYCHQCGALLIERSIYEILKNRIHNGKCPECDAVIPGMF